MHDKDNDGKLSFEEFKSAIEGLDVVKELTLMSHVWETAYVGWTI